MGLYKNTKSNYNSVVKLLICSVILNCFLVLLMFLQNFMFYQTNYKSINQSANQVVNINYNKEEKININKCSKEALETLPGIGDVKSSEIISNRPFNDVYQLKNIIGDKTFYNMLDKVKV